MKKLFILLLFSFGIISPADNNTETKAIMFSDLVVESPAKLMVTGLSLLNDVTIQGRLLVTGEQNSGQYGTSDHFFSGEKALDFPNAGTPTQTLVLSFDASSTQLPSYIELQYFANVVTSNGKPQTGKTFFCKISLLLNSKTVLAVLDKLVYVNGTKDGTASVTPTLIGNILKLNFPDYTMNKGFLCYRLWGFNLIGAS